MIPHGDPASSSFTKAEDAWLSPPDGDTELTELKDEQQHLCSEIEDLLTAFCEEFCVHITPDTNMYRLIAGLSDLSLQIRDRVFALDCLEDEMKIITL